jgi:hypothetical protein
MAPTWLGSLFGLIAVNVDVRRSMLCVSRKSDETAQKGNRILRLAFDFEPDFLLLTTTWVSGVRSSASLATVYVLE